MATPQAKEVRANEQEIIPQKNSKNVKPGETQNDQESIARLLLSKTQCNHIYCEVCNGIT